MRTGVIDIGSNSIKLIIGETEGEHITILEFLKNIVPIGKDSFYKGAIHQETIKQILAIIEKYKNVLKEYDVSNVRLIATAAVREARNKDILVDTLSRKTGFPVEVLTVGDVVYYIDAYLAYKLENRYPVHERNVMIAELGAGSLDISIMEKGFTLLNIGLPVGTLRTRQLLSKLDGSAEESFEAIKQYIENEFSYLKNAFPLDHIDDIILLDESYSMYLSSLIKREGQDPGFFQLSAENIQNILTEFCDKNSEETARQYNIPREISETVCAYAMILNNFAALSKNKYIYILETSLAEAILANMLLGFKLDKRYNKTNQMSSIARFVCHKYNGDFIHAQHVVDLSKSLFEGVRGVIGVNDDDLLYLVLAAYLHDVGSFIHNRAHHKHSEYIINSLNLFRSTQEEIKLIAGIARYHRKATPRSTHLLYNSLSLEKQIIVQKLSALLRIANALDSSHRQKVKKLKVQANRSGDLSLVVHTRENFLLEKMEFSEKKVFFEEITGTKLNLVIKT
ncbi:MAG: HD domain-containing protein [Candidatus Omnitrophica bacterium]|nr:HD domain-containing protein [Candidatus Omnitrophota bacterium]MBU4477657.1 HD domain-containing protein [Candidatus Omnitrophota bacterium]MCG2703148.1 HD domain-containing protein [Candidatus Omnitrophota bacterium]